MTRRGKRNKPTPLTEADLIRVLTAMGATYVPATADMPAHFRGVRLRPVHERRAMAAAFAAKRKPGRPSDNS